MTLLAVAVSGRGLVDPREPLFRADDEALLRGGAAFETLRVYGGRPFELGGHLERLRFSVAALGLPSVDAGAAEEVVELVRGAAPDHVLRLYRTDDILAATAAPLPGCVDELRARGLALGAIDVGEPPRLLAGVKSTSYAVAFAARRQAEQAGADDALLLSGGLVLETATANVWWRRGAVLFTPAAGAGVLPGVTRAVVASLAAGAGLSVSEGAFGVAELVGAHEAFTTSSIREVMPVSSVDGRPIGEGGPGPAASRLQDALRLRSSS